MDERTRGSIQGWFAECQAILAELQALGFRGSYERVHDWVRYRRDQEQARQTKTLTTNNTIPVEAIKVENLSSKTDKVRSFASRQLVWLLLLADDQLTADDQKILEAFGQGISEFLKVREFAAEFQRLLREKDISALESWFTTVKSSVIPDLVSFATYLERERKPLEAAITEVWSKREQPVRCCLVSKNGRTEGHVNRLKLIKRQGYGQAGFELLRKRVLLA